MSSASQSSHRAVIVTRRYEQHCDSKLKIFPRRLFWVDEAHQYAHDERSRNLQRDLEPWSKFKSAVLRPQRAHVVEVSLAASSPSQCPRHIQSLVEFILAWSEGT